jgi:hypothetical protein
LNGADSKLSEPGLNKRGKHGEKTENHNTHTQHIALCVPVEDEEAVVNVDDVALGIDHDVAVVPVLHLKEIADQRVRRHRLHKIETRPVQALLGAVHLNSFKKKTHKCGRQSAWSTNRVRQSGMDATHRLEVLREGHAVGSLLELVQGD